MNLRPGRIGRCDPRTLEVRGSKLNRHYTLVVAALRALRALRHLEMKGAARLKTARRRNATEIGCESKLVGPPITRALRRFASASGPRSSPRTIGPGGKPPRLRITPTNPAMSITHTE